MGLMRCMGLEQLPLLLETIENMTAIAVVTILGWFFTSSNI